MRNRQSYLKSMRFRSFVLLGAVTLLMATSAGCQFFESQKLSYDPVIERPKIGKKFREIFEKQRDLRTVLTGSSNVLGIDSRARDIERRLGIR